MPGPLTVCDVTRDGDLAELRLRLKRPVRFALGRGRIDVERRDAAGQPIATELAVVFLAEAGPAQLPDHELDPVALLVLVVAQPVKHPQHGFSDAENLRRRDELVQRRTGPDQNRRAAADGDAESAAAAGRDDGAKPEIVDRGGDVIDRAAFEGDLELAGQRRAEWMAQQEAGHRFGVRRHVEDLVAGNAGIRTRRDVAHRVAARFARRQPVLGEPAQRRLHVVQLDEVELDVLPRGDVTEAARILLADVGERDQLVGRQQALRDLDAKHLRVFRLTLPIGAAHETVGAPLIGSHLSPLIALDGADEFVDFRFARKGQARTPESLGIVND